MSPERPGESAEMRAHNMATLQLDDARYERWKALIAASPARWPPLLLAYCRDQARVLGYSGGALGDWVADWLRARPTEEEEGAGPTPEPAAFMGRVEETG